MARRIDAVDWRRQHGDSCGSSSDRRAVRSAVDAQRQAGNHHDAGSRQVIGDLGRDRNAVAGGAAGPDNGDGTPMEDRGRADDEECRWPGIKSEQRRWVRLVEPGDHATAGALGRPLQRASDGAWIEIAHCFEPDNCLATVPSEIVSSVGTRAPRCRRGPMPRQEPCEAGRPDARHG